MPLTDMVLRLGVACVLCFLIGLDREYRNRPAGLRTTMLTGLASAAFAIIALEMVSDLSDPGKHTRFDPVRIIEAVTAGVAFLAAGTIIQAKDGIKGLTTGASMWLSGAIGIACGLGYLMPAFLVTGLAVLVLHPIYWIEKRIPNGANEPLDRDQKD